METLISTLKISSKKKDLSPVGTTNLAEKVSGLHGYPT